MPPPTEEQQQQKNPVQVIPIDISTGSVWASDHLTSVQNRYINVFVGLDGAVYTLPIKKNKKKVRDEEIRASTAGYKDIVVGRVFSIKKIGSGSIPFDVKSSADNRSLGAYSDQEFSRFVYVSLFDYGCLNFYYDRSLVPNEKFEVDQASPFSELQDLKSFDKRIFNYKVFIEPNPKNFKDDVKYFLGASNISIAVDERHNQVIFPAFWMWQSFVPQDDAKEHDAEGNYIGDEGLDQTYDRRDVFQRKCMGSIIPRNMVAASINFTTPENEKVKPLRFSSVIDGQNIDVPITKNDFCNGAFSIASHMVYYSHRFNEIRVSEPIVFDKMQTRDDTLLGDETILSNITVPYQIQDIEYHNNYLMVLRPDGITRFQLNTSADTPTLFMEDPLFFIPAHVRFNSSVKSIDTELLFFNEEGYIKSIKSSSDASVNLSQILPTSLPKARGFPIFDNVEYAKSSGIVTIFDMDFLFIGNWLINLSKQRDGERIPTVSNYQLDSFFGMEKKYPENKYVVDREDPAHLCFSISDGDIVCDYNSIGVFQTYEETIISMIENKGDLPLSFDTGDFSYGRVKNITTKPLIRDSGFRLCRLLLSLRMDLLEGLDSMPDDYELNLYLKKITHQDNDDFSYDDERTWTNQIEGLPDEENIINLRDYVSGGIFTGDRKPPIVFNLELSDVNYISFSLTWKGSYPIVIEKLEVEIEN